MKIKDLTGKRFGKLLVIKLENEKKNGKYVWLCLCDCGEYYKGIGTALSAGKVRSCGCLKLEDRIDKDDIVGELFNQLLVLNFVSKDKYGESLYLCRCICGKEKIIRKSLLKTGKTKSCGCLRENDLTNKTFGKYKVLKRSEDRKKYWICECQCGKIKEVRGSHLTDGTTISCGCEGRKRASLANRKDLRGQKFGRLHVIDYVENNNKKHSYYLCQCECGNKKEVRSSHLITGNIKSCGCLSGKEERISVHHNSVLPIITEKDISEWDYQKNTVSPDLYTVGSVKKVWWKCNKCGFSWKTEISSKMLGYGCPKCKSSKGEKVVRDILEYHNINFEEQKRFKDCKNKNPLPFDFYLPDYRICIEYQGIQHYIPIKRFGGIESFYRAKKNDYIKRAFCKNKNIKLLEIPYWYKDISKELILECIEEIKCL